MSVCRLRFVGIAPPHLSVNSLWIQSESLPDIPVYVSLTNTMRIYGICVYIIYYQYLCVDDRRKGMSYKQPDRQTNRHTDWQAGRQAGRQGMVSDDNFQYLNSYQCNNMCACDWASARKWLELRPLHHWIRQPHWTPQRHLIPPRCSQPQTWEQMGRPMLHFSECCQDTAESKLFIPSFLSRA